MQTVTLDNLTVTLQQQAYLDHQDGVPCYMALALNNDLEYMVYWDILPGYFYADGGDESDVCDWDNPSQIDLLGHAL